MLLMVPKRLVRSLLWWGVPANLLRGSPFLPSTPSVTNNRCFPLGLGSSYRHGLYWGTLTSIPHRKMYQLLGTSCNTMGSTVLPPPPSARPDCTNTLRQHNSCGLPQPPSQYSVTIALPAGHRPLGLLHSKFNSPCSCASARSAQHDSGCPQQGFLTIPRDGIELDFPKSSIRLLGDANHGRLHDMPQYEVQCVLMQGQDGSSLAGRRPPPTMDFSTSLHVSPNSIDRQDSAKDSSRKTWLRPHHSLVALANMLPPVAVASQRSSHVSSECFRPSALPGPC